MSVDVTLVNIKHETALLSGRWYMPEEGSRKGVIFSHGLFSSKDGYKITRLADAITGAGFSLLTFDFRYAGDSGEDISSLSLRGEVEDLAAVVDYARGRGLEEIHLMGSSMGAAVTLLYTGEAETSPSSLITIAAPVRLFEILPGMTREKAFSLPVEGYTSVEGIPMRNSFFRELADADIISLLPKITIPLLLIHGGRDSVVAPSQAEILQREYGGPLRCRILEEGDHNLITERDLEDIRGEVVSWLEGGPL